MILTIFDQDGIILINFNLGTIMLIEDIINENLTYFIKDDALRFCKRHELLEEKIESAITDVIQKLSKKELLTAKEIDAFKKELSLIKNPKLHDCLVGIIKNMSQEIFESYRNEIEKSVNEIEQETKSPKENKESIEKYAGFTLA